MKPKSDFWVFRARGGIWVRIRVCFFFVFWEIQPPVLLYSPPSPSFTFSSLSSYRQNDFWDAWASKFSKHPTLLAQCTEPNCSALLSFFLPCTWVPLLPVTMTHSSGWWPLAGSSIPASDILVATASSSYRHNSCESGRFCSEGDQMDPQPEEWWRDLDVTTTPSAGRWLRFKSRQVLWFSTTKQLTASEWAFPTFAKNRGCLSKCQAVGRFKKSKFNRWLVPPCLAAANGWIFRIWCPNWASWGEVDEWGQLPSSVQGRLFLHHSCLMTSSIDFSSAAFQLLIPSQPLGRKMCLGKY